MLPDRQSGVLTSTLQSHIIKVLQVGRAGFEPAVFTLWVPVLQTGAFTITLPAVIDNLLNDNNNNLPFSLILSFFFVTSCPRACTDRYKLFSFKSTIRVTIPLRQFGRLECSLLHLSCIWGEKCLFSTPHIKF